MVLSCALVQRAMTKTVKLRSAAFHNAAVTSTKRIKIWSAVQIKNKDRQVANVRSQVFPRLVWFVRASALIALVCSLFGLVR